MTLVMLIRTAMKPSSTKDSAIGDAHADVSDLVRLGGESGFSFDAREVVRLPLVADADRDPPVTSQALALDASRRHGEGEFVTLEDETDGGDVRPPVEPGES
jgi:hypothetical protein